MCLSIKGILESLKGREFARRFAEMTQIQKKVIRMFSMVALKDAWRWKAVGVVSWAPPGLSWIYIAAGLERVGWIGISQMHALFFFLCLFFFPIVLGFFLSWNLYKEKNPPCGLPLVTCESRLVVLSLWCTHFFLVNHKHHLLNRENETTAAIMQRRGKKNQEILARINWS